MAPALRPIPGAGCCRCSRNISRLLRRIFPDTALRNRRRRTGCRYRAWRPTLGGLLRKLEVRPEVAVGHSAGAAILARMCLAGRMSPRLLVALNGAFMPFGGVATHFFSPLAKLLVVNPLVPRVFAWQASHAGAVERLIANTGSTIDQEGVALYRKLVRNPMHVAAALRMMANWKLEPLLHDLPRLAPALVLVTAGNDRSISPVVAQQVREILPNAVIERLPGLGHLAHEEQPQLIAHLVERYARATAAEQVRQ